MLQRLGWLGVSWSDNRCHFWLVRQVLHDFTYVAIVGSPSRVESVSTVDSQNFLQTLSPQWWPFLKFFIYLFFGGGGGEGGLGGVLLFAYPSAAV